MDQDSKSPSSEVEQKTVALLEFGSSKQQLKLKDPSFPGVVVEVEKALGAIGRDVSVLCAGKSPTGSKETFVLQIWSQRWNSFVNMSHDDSVKDGDRLTVSQLSQKELEEEVKVKKVVRFSETSISGLTKRHQKKILKMSRSSSSVTCQCKLELISDFCTEILHKRRDNTFQGGFPESQVNSILDAWNAVVTHDFRDAEYKSLWSEIYSLTANFARCPQHASLWGISPSHSSGSGGVNVVVEGFPVPVTPANSTDSCNSEPMDEPHAVDTVRMTGLPDFCVTVRLSGRSLIDIENKKDGGGLDQLLYCLLGHTLQFNSDMFGMYCDRNHFHPWLVKWESTEEDNVVVFYHSRENFEGLEGLLKCQQLMWRHIAAQAV